MFADAGLVCGVLRGAAGESVFHRQQRHGRVLHETTPQCRRRYHALDFRRCAGRRHAKRWAPRKTMRQGKSGGANKLMSAHHHERFSSRFGVESLIR